jgi:hypothetical protein
MSFNDFAWLQLSFSQSYYSTYPLPCTHTHTHPCASPLACFFRFPELLYILYCFRLVPCLFFQVPRAPPHTSLLQTCTLLVSSGSQSSSTYFIASDLYLACFFRFPELLHILYCFRLVPFDHSGVLAVGRPKLSSTLEASCN